MLLLKGSVEHKPQYLFKAFSPISRTIPIL